MSTPTLRGPHWLVARQHRPALWTAAGLLVTVTAALIALRVWVVSTRDEAACLAGDFINCEPRLFNGQGTPSGLLRLMVEFTSAGLMFLPFLLGAFVAGPMIARELESGTYKLAWTQSVSPTRWLASKLTVASVVAVALSALYIAAFRYGWAPVAGTYGLSWWDRGVYEATGPVLVAYCLLATAVGAVVGQLVRRTLPAMALTGLITGAVLLLISSVRWDVWPSERLTAATTDRLTALRELGRNDFTLRTGYVTESGEELAYDACWRPTGRDECPADLGITGWFADYHPAAHYWQVQAAESAVVLGLAALAVIAAFRLLRRSHA
ncbi:ABC transporter permease [Streptomyces sp. NPDC047928]|uniref:ABC transporter permease n=1 Tax=unclassified Streptomyces TaxID=2593676 RepID=UPI00371010FC